MKMKGKLKTVELFAGTQSFSKVARELGHETFCVDNNDKFENDMTLDLLEGIPIKLLNKIKEADIIWMSPPCTTFSMAAGNTHWNADKTPKTQKAIDGKKLLDICLVIAKICIQKGKLFFIENPRARARWFLPVDIRKTAWYCKYGSMNAKPTDIWTNLDWTPKTCHNFLKNQPKHCHHESAPRGSKTGTQGLKGNMERSVIPSQLFYEIFDRISATKFTPKNSIIEMMNYLNAKVQLIELIINSQQNKEVEKDE